MEENKNKTIIIPAKRAKQGRLQQKSVLAQEANSDAGFQRALVTILTYFRSVEQILV